MIEEKKVADPTLSLIIVNWNTKDYLCSCLQSILQHPSPFALEVIVIDNASNDGSAAMVEKNFPLIRLIKNRNNLGFARACNQGWRLAQGKYLLFLNPDTLLGPHVLEEAIKIMEANEEIGILGIRHLNEKGKPRRSAYDLPSPLRVLAMITGLNKLLPPYRFRKENKRKATAYIQGSFLLTRRSLLKELNGFDENFFMYCEDADLCLRAWKKGWQVIYEPSLKVIHFESQSPREPLAIIHDYVRSLLYFSRKNLSLKETKRIKLALKAGLSLLKLKSLISYFFDSKQSQQNLAKINLYLSWLK